MEWLKEILKGRKDAEELEKQITAGIGQVFVSKRELESEKKEKEMMQKSAELAQQKKLEMEGEINRLKEESSSLQKNYAEQVKILNDKLQNQKIKSAIETAIISAGGKNTKAIMALLDLNAVSLSREGKLTGLHLEKVKQEAPYLFYEAQAKYIGNGCKKSEKGSPFRTQFAQGVFGK